MTNKFAKLNQEHINTLFKSHYYKCIPLEYIDFVKLHDHNNIVKTYNRAQISNKIESMDTKFATIHSLYNVEDIMDIQIGIRHDKITDDVNQKLSTWFEEVLEHKKSED